MNTTQAMDAYQEYQLTMRSKTTFKTDTTTIRVWSGQLPLDVATRVADGYGATVESLTDILMPYFVKQNGNYFVKNHDGSAIAPHYEGFVRDPDGKTGVTFVVDGQRKTSSNWSLIDPVNPDWQAEKAAHLERASAISQQIKTIQSTAPQLTKAWKAEIGRATNKVIITLQITPDQKLGATFDRADVDAFDNWLAGLGFDQARCSEAMASITILGTSAGHARAVVEASKNQ